MSVGQRITQKRTELALSQEALGGQLGVSRQAIHQWEADAALPELDALIALAELYGVSVGWLLGVEAAPAPESPAEEGPPPGGSACDQGELSEAQLAMVRAIVTGYTAALPRPPDWFLSLCKAAGVLLAIGAIVLAFRLADLKSSLNHVQNLSEEISRTLSESTALEQLSGRVDTALQTQSPITARYTVELTGADLAANTLTFALQAVPRIYTETLQAAFLISSGGTVHRFPAEKGPDGVFAAQAAVPLTDHISVSVTFLAEDGLRQTQLLEDYRDLYHKSLVSDWIETGFYQVTPQGRTVTFRDHLVYTDKTFAPGLSLHPDSPPAQAVSVRVGLFLNRQLIGWAEPCAEPPERNLGYRGLGGKNLYTFYRLPDCTVTLTPSDRLCVAALVEDSYGRTYFADHRPCALETNRNDSVPRLHDRSPDEPWAWACDVTHWTF